MRSIKSFLAICVALGSLSATGDGQVIHSGEETFVIAVTGGEGVTFRGSYLVTGINGESKETQVAGTVPADFRAVGTAVYLNLQNQSPGDVVEMRVGADGKRELDKNSASAMKARFLAVRISQNGTTLKVQRTDAPKGVVSLATAMPPQGLPRQTELTADGSAKFAFLTYTSETGDIQQELVPIPFSKSFFPKEGWIVAVSAQKVRVTRMDPASISPRVEVLDDGERGTLHVAIREISGVTREAQTTEAFGVASASLHIQ
jgi:hypothetical protein